MTTAATTPDADTTDAAVVDQPVPVGGRLEGVDLARALAMFGMFVAHALILAGAQDENVLWAGNGREAPLFVLLAGTGLTLGTRAPRSRARAMNVVRAVVLLVIGLALATQTGGVILQYYALYFLVGLCVLRLPRRALGALAGACLLGGPLVLTALVRAGTVDRSFSRADVGLAALADPVALVRALALEGAYPAIVWLGFFFAGMMVGRMDLASSRTRARLFVGGAVVAVLAFITGWAGARAHAPADVDLTEGLALAPAWSYHWTTYGHSESLAWTVSSTAVAVAVVGACLWLAACWPRGRVLGPPIALGQMALSFYLFHLLYLDTVGRRLDPQLTSGLHHFVAAIAFWAVFALLAQQWMRRARRGPLESVVHAVATVIVRPRAVPAARRP